MKGDEGQRTAEARGDPGRGRLARPVSSLVMRLAIRWPAIAVLRLPELLAWIVLSNLAAFCVAPMYAGASTREVSETNAYMQVCFVIAFAIACLWIAWQWRDRASLPERHAFPVAWSPGASSIISVLIFSPVVTAGFAADSHLRALITWDELSQDLRTLDQAGHRVMGLRYKGPTLRFGWSDFGRRAAPPPATMFQTLLDDGQSLTKEEFGALARYAIKGSVADASSCAAKIRGAPPCANVKFPLKGRYVITGNENDLPCIETMSSDCRFHMVAWQIQRNIERLALAHGHLERPLSVPRGDGTRTTNRAWSEDPESLLVLAFVAVLLGFVAGCASVVSFRMVITTCTVTAIAIGLVPSFGPLFEAIGIHPSRVLLTISHSWQLGRPIVCGVLLTLGLAIGALRWRSRTTARDLCVVLVLIGPLSIVAMESQWLLVSESWPKDMRNALVVSVLLGFLITPLISRYRKLPWTT